MACKWECSIRFILGTQTFSSLGMCFCDGGCQVRSLKGKYIEMVMVKQLPTPYRNHNHSHGVGGGRCNKCLDLQFRRLDTFFCPLQTPGMQVCTDMHVSKTLTHLNFFLILKKRKNGKSHPNFWFHSKGISGVSKRSRIHIGLFL